MANFIVALVGGLLVHHKGIKTNYTRKINHFALFFLPMAVYSLFTYEESLLTIILSFAISIAFLAIYVEPIRERIGIIKTAFLSFDRPEDRPHTLLWLSTQIGATFLMMIPTMIYLYSVERIALLYIPILINGIGDGLAEPVGIRFGKHTYEVNALFSKKKYVRSIEGSVCVLVTSLIVTLLLYSSFTSNQFIAALIAIPIVMTLAEAVAPLIERITHGRVNLRIISNLATKRLARAWTTITKEELGGDEIVDGIIEAHSFAMADPYRAATHNKGALNGIIAVVVATCNDHRAVEAGAHAYAARSGQYSPLTVWEKNKDGNLLGSIELPMAVGIIGGAIRVHPVAKIALKILGVSTAKELAEVLAAVGLAQNLGALRALAHEGIQRGHMALHARNVE